MRAIWPAGDAALLVDADGIAARLASAITSCLPGILDVVPGASTVLVVASPGSWDLAELARRIRSLPVPEAPARQQSLAELPVAYDGPDLAEVAVLTGLTADEVIARHQAGEYRVGWLGFSPGFGYLTGLDPALAAIPRLDTPRQSVPAGSVALAGGLTAVYPAASPGGWRLLGRTSARMWSPDRDPPALLAPGMRVRFRAVGAGDLPDPGSLAAAGDAKALRSRAGAVEVLRPGPLATIQDLGRTGYGHLGVPTSGAADPASLRRANRLVGNDDGAAGLEFTLGRAELRFHADVLLAVTGAPAPVSVTAGGRSADREVTRDRAFAVPAGMVLRLGAPATGLRSYLAVGGGIDVPALLGSRSADLLSGLGPAPLRPGDRLPVGPSRPPGEAEPQAATTPRAWSGVGMAGPPAARDDADARVRILAGPRDDWFVPEALRTLTAHDYQATPASNRTGLRLAGPALARERAGELPSEGMVTGAIQVPHDGQPILMLADHPTTGGYPVIAVVHSADIGLLAQLRPGQRIRFALAGQR